MFNSKYFQAIIAGVCVFLITLVIFSLGLLASNSIQADMHVYGNRRIEENRDRRRTSLVEIFYRESTTMEIIAKSLESIPNPEHKLEIIKDYAKKAEYDAMSLADINGKAITTRGMELNISHRQYFKDLLQNSKTIVSDPIPSMLDGNENTVVMIASPLYEQGKLVGLVAGSYSGIYLSQKLAAPYSGWGHDLLVCGNGRIFAQTQGCPRHPSIGHNLTDVFSENALEQVQHDMRERQNGQMNFTYLGDKAEWSVSYSPVGINDWYIFSLVPIAVLSPYKDLTTMRIELTIVTLIAACLAGIAGYWAHSRKRIGRKLLLTFLGLALIGATAGGVGGVQLINVYTAYSKAMGRYTTELSNLGQIALSISNTRTELGDAMLTDDLVKRQEACDRARASAAKTDTYRAALKMQLQNTAIGKQWDDLELHFKCFADLRTQMLDVAASREPDLGTTQTTLISNYSQSVRIALEKLRHLIEVDLADTTKTDDSLRNDSIMAVLFVLTVTVVALALSIILARWTARSIRRPLGEIEAVTEKIAKYQTDFSLSESDDDEIGVIAKAFNTSVKTAFVELNSRNKTIIDSITYANKIQRNLLPHDMELRYAFSDHAIIWQPKDIVGGDIYWLRNFDGGTVVCVADCTGHGTPGALLTMLVVSTLQTSVTAKNYQNPQDIVWEIEKRLKTALHVDAPNNSSEKRDIVDFRDGCDLAVLFVAKDKSIKIAAANTNVFICDGKQVTQLKGQRLRIGEGELTSKDTIEVTTVPANPANKFYIATDGLYDQNGAGHEKFGYRSLKDIILAEHNTGLRDIIEKVWQAFENHRANAARRDDVQMVAFKP